MNDLVVGHGSSRPLSQSEEKQLSDIRLRDAERRKNEAERKKQLEGYRFWCSEGCGFVEEHHMCAQWTQITYVSPALYRAIKEGA